MPLDRSLLAVAAALATVAVTLTACADPGARRDDRGTDAPSIAERAGDRRTVAVHRGAYDPAVSPDGSTIALGILGKIWLLPADGGEAEQLTSGRGWAHDPAWSPDGRHLAWVHDTPASSEIVLHTFATGTSRTVHASSPSDVNERYSWGPVFSFKDLTFHPTDGRLYFTHFRSGVWSVAARGRPGEPERLLPGSERPGEPGITDRSSFAFSPDGGSMAVTRDTTKMWSHLHVTPLDTVDYRQLTDADTVKRGEVYWSPAGDSVVYLELADGRESVAVRSTSGDGETRRIELGPFNGRELALFPGGDRALVVSQRRLFDVDLATGESTPVPFEATLSLPSRATGDLVITNARLFDATGSEAIENATVEVRRGTITSVTAGPWEGDADVRVIDAEGRFLMPGVVQSHDHISMIQDLSMTTVPRMGITTVFDLGSYLPETLNLRDAVRLGVLDGPHIYTVGSAVNGPGGRARSLTVSGIAEPDDARAVVREQAEAGVDAVKIYAFLEPGAARAAIDEAHALGLPAVGDFVKTSWSEGLEAGVDGFIHLFDHKWRFLSDERPPPEEGPFAVVEPDSARVHAFFSEVAERGRMFDPTAMVSAGYLEAEEFADSLEAQAGGREEAGDGDGAGGSPDELSRPRIVAELLRALHREGVRWVAGTDASASNLFDELEIYEIAGIPNAKILRSATSNPARWFREDDFGTVEPGKRADLILVDGDPLERIRDLENVELVVKSGRVVLEK